MTTIAPLPRTQVPIPRRAQVDPRMLAVAVATAYLEVRAGRRPGQQLDPLLSHPVRRQLAALIRKSRGDHSPLGGISVRRALLMIVREGVVEATVIVHDGRRTGAVAVRLECWRDRWVVTGLGAPEDQAVMRRGTS
jgi:hypothetical protein